VLSSARTDQSQFSFPPGFWHETEHVQSDAGFWHQKNLVPEKYDTLTSFWYQKLASVSSLLAHNAQIINSNNNISSIEDNKETFKA